MTDEGSAMGWEGGYAAQDGAYPYAPDGQPGWAGTGQDGSGEPGGVTEPTRDGTEPYPDDGMENPQDSLEDGTGNLEGEPEGGDGFPMNSPEEPMEDSADNQEDRAGNSLEDGQESQDSEPESSMEGELETLQDVTDDSLEDEVAAAQGEPEDRMGEEPGRTGNPPKKPAGGQGKRHPDGESAGTENETAGDNQAGDGTKGQAGSQPSRKTAGRRSSQAASRPRTRPSASVLSIDGELVAETDAEKAKNDLLDLLESQKTGRILAGTIQGVEGQSSDPSRTLAVIYHGEYKVIIPAEEAVELPEDLKGRTEQEMYHYMLNKRLGAEADYIVKGIDADAGVAVASRLEAMRAKRKEYYTDRGGSRRVRPGICAEARVVSVIRTGIFVDLFGLESYIPLRELSYQRWMDAAAYFQSGQRVLVKVLDVGRAPQGGFEVEASVKQASENPYEKALRRYSVGNRYVGTVSMVDTNGVFVALDGGIDCLCSNPKRGRPPRGARATVRILGINDETNRIWGAITHIAAPH